MIVILMGVSGSGKTRVGTLLAKETGWEFFDGDDYHSEENVSKMASGIPLTENDRALWLERLREILLATVERDQDCILACSALTEDFRRKLLNGLPEVKLVHLQGTYDTIKSRMERRSGHYFKPGLLKSQFETLESPETALRIEITASPDEIVEKIRQSLE